MPKPYSIDLRKRVVDAYDKGMSPEKVAKLFNVSDRWIYSLLKKRKEHGTIEPLEPTGGPNLKLIKHRESIEDFVREKPDATLNEITEALKLDVCIATVHNMLKRMGITYKKSHPCKRAAQN